MPDSDALPCGTSIDDIFLQVVDHVPASDPQHRATCRHCRAAAAELEQLWSPVRELSAEEVAVPSRLLDSVMAKVRRIPRETWHAVIPTDRGDTRVAARVVGAVARLAAEQVPQVSLALGRGQTASSRAPADIAGTTGEAATDIGIAGTHVVVDVQIVVELGARIPDLAQRVRDTVARHIADLVGLTAAEVNVVIVDVLPPGDV